MNLDNKLFFIIEPEEDFDGVYGLSEILDRMEDEEWDEAELELAEKDPDSIYCRAWGDQGTVEKIDKPCGKHCNRYSPRNGKFGICKYNSTSYTGSNKAFILKKDGTLSKK